MNQLKPIDAATDLGQQPDVMLRAVLGIVHDVNNLLTVIGSLTESLEVENNLNAGQRECVREIGAALRWSANLTQQVGMFRRGKRPAPEVLSLNAVIREMEPLVRRLVPPAVSFDTRLANDAGATCIDKGQLVQVLLNLVTNAVEAMPDGGYLRVATRNTRHDELPRDLRHSVSAPQFVSLIVADTGVGMSRQVQQHIFEPYFTTKTGEQGLGMGLATVQWIVSSYGGIVSVNTDPGRGTSFQVHLPRAGP